MADRVFPQSNGPLISAYGDGGFRFGPGWHRGGVIVLPGKVLDWEVDSPEAIDFASLAPVVEAAPRPEILLIGFGARMVIVPAELRAALREAGMSVDGMDTGAACRTFNVLISEERPVAAALLAVD